MSFKNDGSFLEQMLAQQLAQQQPCRYFNTANGCDKGARCKNLHIAEQPTVVEASKPDVEQSASADAQELLARYAGGVPGAEEPEDDDSDSDESDEESSDEYGRKRPATKRRRTHAALVLNASDYRQWKMRADFGTLPAFIEYIFKKFLAELQVESRGAGCKGVEAQREAAQVEQLSLDMHAFFELLQANSLAPEVLQQIGEIADWVSKREYTEANKVYLNLSIGKDAWPIGIGKCNTYEQLKNRGVDFNRKEQVLDDETRSKYIKGMKRLITHAARAHPNAAPSKNAA